jgi:predicted phage tail component-like protein
MNYIEINGIKSTLVQGLIIQSLPPITKPKMRTSVEEIDGRDGDIVTELGYSAYDKKISIGLYGDFKIDDVISYFSKSGEVVFSNEPDKYYNFAILDQIDFERLIRFKTATVTFHVQPFKYSDVDRVYDFDNNYIKLLPYNETNNGITASYTGDKLNLKGTATQNAEFYIPIVLENMNWANYSLIATSSGTVNGSAIRLITDSPIDKNSFGQGYVSLINNGTAKKSAYDTSLSTYKYIWVFVPKGTVVSGSVSIVLKNDDLREIKITNRGNIISRPKITIYGSGYVDLFINLFTDPNLMLTLNINDNYIVIDSEKLNAYNENGLKNRQVKGDLSKFYLNVGENSITWTGNVDSINIENFSRWL